jgi:hypothetical protein
VSGYDWTGVVASGRTAAETAAAMAADPAIMFGSDPNSALGYVVTSGAWAHNAGGQSAQAAYWTHVACYLVAAADNPNVARGAVLEGLVERYGAPSDL